MKFIKGIILVFGTLLTLILFWFGTEYPGLFDHRSLAQGLVWVFGSMYIIAGSCALAICINKDR